MADTTIDAHAILDDWVVCTLLDGAQFVIGTISGDAKGRFRDGVRMSTSLLETTTDGIVEGAIVATCNSRYLLGRRETDEARMHDLIVGFARHAARERNQE